MTMIEQFDPHQRLIIAVVFAFVIAVLGYAAIIPLPLP